MRRPAHPRLQRSLAAAGASLLLGLATTGGTALAHAYPKTSDPAPNARLDATPAHVSITYDSQIDPHRSGIVLLDGTGSLVTTTPDQVDGTSQTSISPPSDLPPGPYTVAWTSLSAEDGHQAEGFYTFVVNGGPVGILNGTAQSQVAAADLVATLTVGTAADGGSSLRVDLNNSTGVERVRIGLAGPDLGQDLLDTRSTDDGGWVLEGNEVSLPGSWQAVVIVRRTNVVDDASAAFYFAVDPATGAPAFTTAHSITSTPF